MKLDRSRVGAGNERHHVVLPLLHVGPDLRGVKTLAFNVIEAVTQLSLESAVSAEIIISSDMLANPEIVRAIEAPGVNVKVRRSPKHRTPRTIRSWLNAARIAFRRDVPKIIWVDYSAPWFIPRLSPQMLVNFTDARILKSPTPTPAFLSRRILIPSMLKRVGRVLVISDSARRDITSQLAPHRRLHVWPLFPRMQFRSLDEDLSYMEGREQGRVLVVGTTNKHKRVSLVAEAVKTLQDAGSPVQLVIVGSAGNAERDLAVHLQGLQPQALRLNDVPDEALVEEYLRAQIFVQASEYEGFGLAPLEAAMCGCHVVLSDIPPHRETMSGAATFFTVDDSMSLSASLSSALANPDRVPVLDFDLPARAQALLKHLDGNE